MKRGGPIRARSAKRASLYRTEYGPLVARILAERPRCEFPLGCDQPAQGPHYLAGRTGYLLTYEPWIRSSCHLHNEFAESHPLQAEAIGWRLRRVGRNHAA